MPRLLCALLLALPLLAACGGDDTDRPDGDSAPAGTRWVGAAGVVVAVPDWWTTGETQCGAPVEDTVYADAAAQVECEDPDVPATIQEVAALAVLDATSGYGAEQLRTMVPVAGRPDLVERPGCEQWYDGVCRHLFALRGSDVVLAVTVTDDSGTTWAAVRDSARAVPAGRTTVPISLAGTWATPTWGEPPPAAAAMTDALQAAGLRVAEVLVIDRSGICEETSSGNAAALAFSDILPMASKGVMGKVPGWLMDPLGPFTIRPSYFLKMIPWLYRFWRASSAEALEKTTVAQGNMMQLAQREMLGLIDRAGLRDRLQEDGNLELYESEAELAASQPGWDAKAKAGIAYEHVRGTRLKELQPGLDPRFVAGTFVPGWKNVSDPKLFGQAIWAYAESKGARFLHAKVKHAASQHGGATVHLEDGTEIRAAHLVLMAGAWSKNLAQGFGDAVPLDTERGYNTTLPVGSFDVKRQLTFPGHGFVITPMATGLRVGGAVEFGGLQLPPNYARSAAMLKKASMFLPGLKIEGGRQWMGYRPSMPDSMPVIGRASAGGNIYYGFGHGHLGLTQSAATGRIICDLITGSAPAVDIEPFKPQRFRN